MFRARSAELALYALAAALGLLMAGASGGQAGHGEPFAQAGEASRAQSVLSALYEPPGGASSAGSPVSEPFPPKDPRMSSHVARLASAASAAAARGEAVTALNLSPLAPDLKAMADRGMMRIDRQGALQVYVIAGRTVDDVAADIEAGGGRVERIDANERIVQARVAVDRLEELARRPSVKFIRLPDYSLPQTGSVTTQGDSLLAADAVRATLAVDGSGSRVGVLSDGVDGIAASQASGDLPAVNTATCNVAAVDPTLFGSEGTAMLEIAHDMAPGAELWFGNFGLGTSLDFNAAVDCLAANTDIVVDDVAWFNAGPYDGTSIVSANTTTELNRASNPIRAYATAVGNEAPGHYQEPFFDSGFDLDATWDLHRFRATASTSDAGLGLPCDVATPSVFCGDSIFLGAGGFIAVFLQWNDPWTASSNDYDLFLLDETAGTFPALSVNVQNGTQPPAEALPWANPGAARWVDVVIGRFAGLARTFDMFVICGGCALFPNNAIQNFNTIGSSVPNQADAGGGVISAGAINASDPGTNDIAFYSSRGPTNDSRLKPDVSGVDCVSVTGAGGFPSTFCGTSAAVPHLAGIAALLLECNVGLLAGEPGDNPTADRTALRNGILNNAIDLGAPGADNTFGFGRANASNSAAGTCADIDTDGVFDTIDNCPAWPNPSQALPPWTVPPNDPDCDSFTDTEEAFVGTDHLDPCANTAAANDEADDRWPADIDDNQAVNILDVLQLVPPVFNTSPPDPNYSARKDVTADGAINILDILRLVPPVFNESCT